MIHSSVDLFTPPIPINPSTHYLWSNLHGAAASLAIANAAIHHTGLIMVIADDGHAVVRLQQELNFFTQHTTLEILTFPDWETLPYDVFSPLPELVSERLLTLHKLANITRGILIVSAATVLQRLPPRKYLEAHTLLIQCGDRLNPEYLCNRLINAGYTRVTQVFSHGEFTIRGSIIDLFPMGAMQPFRLDLLDDLVDSIRVFDQDTQRSYDQVTAIRFLPAREVPLDNESIKNFRHAFETTFGEDPKDSLIYHEMLAGHAPGGIEYYLPLFYDYTSTLFEFLPQHTTVIQWNTMQNAVATFERQIFERYEQLRYDIERPLLPPLQLYLDIAELNAALKKLARISIQTQTQSERPRGIAAVYNFATQPLPQLIINDKFSKKLANLHAFLCQEKLRTLFVAESPGRREHILNLLQELNLNAQLVDSWQTFFTATHNQAITVAPLEQGLYLNQMANDTNIAIIPEALLYSEHVRQERRRKSTFDPDQIVRSFTELHLGDPVVHEKHGIGRYRGLQTIEVGGIETELLTIEYQRGDKLYVPVASLHLISRYVGINPDTAPLHKLGSDQWEKVKRRAVEKIHDVATELLEIQARRQQITENRRPRIEHNAEYAQFKAAFPFEETYDQQNAIQAVLQDLTHFRPMDRVVCGDVGFGKTEVAQRACFHVIHHGQQVALLVPTTLLAEQHYTNFCDRFADWPVRIESISRFKTQKEQKIIATDLAEGKIDLIIGTHKLLQPNIRFHKLGLIIIDEEHRFGVRDKERLKMLRAEVDCLTLTATPIPRTLNMALAGIRDLSIIATPPAGRYPIKTFVTQWNDALIIEACQRELKRGGQIYFLHNEVKTIDSIADKIRQLLPNIKCEVAHGQMRERQLEHVMQDFYHQRFNILVCTTIIESGIDIPTANTIIINRADKLGLAQLHQIRGRVGRSHHRAYAYLIVPLQSLMTADAKKRLAAIESMEDLGSGFNLATYDLEIRGAGELLGKEQSGQIEEIGFSLYMELLERTVKAMQSGQPVELTLPIPETTEIDLHLPALLPDNYVPDVHARLVLYKRIANAADNNTLRELQIELIDRFGLLPQQAKNLFATAELKQSCIRLGICKIEAGTTGGRIVFDPATKISPTKIIEMVQQRPTELRFVDGNTLRITKNWTDAAIRLKEVQAMINELLIV